MPEYLLALSLREEFFLQNGLVILDLGFGDGCFMQDVLNRYPSVTVFGIDGYPSTAGNGKNQIQGLFNELPQFFAENTFTHIVSVFSFPYYIDERNPEFIGSVFSGISRVLKPKGLVRFNTYKMTEEVRDEERILLFSAKCTHSGDIVYFTITESDLLLKFGLRIIEIQNSDIYPNSLQKVVELQKIK